MNPSYSQLTELNPHLKNKTEDEINELIKALNSCGYEWDEGKKEFVNREIGEGIMTSGLDFFTPELIIEKYKEWSDRDSQKVYKYAKEFKKTFWITIFIAITSFRFLRWEFALIITGTFIAYTLYEFFRWQDYRKPKNKREIEQEKKKGAYVDVSKIKWCKTCSHFKKIPKYEYYLYSSSEMLSENKIPCKIFNDTKELWEEYFSSNLNNRYLYPKNCLKWKKR